MTDRDDTPGGAPDQPLNGDPEPTPAAEPSPPASDATPPTESFATPTDATPSQPTESSVTPTDPTPPQFADATPPPAPPPPDPVPPAAWAAPAAPGPAAPMVAWPAAADTRPQANVGAYLGGVPPFTIGALLKDTFARYGADPIRLYLIAAVTGLLSYASSFAAIGSNPLVGGGVSRGFVDVSGVLGLLSFVVGVVSGSATFALLEGGRRMPVGRVLRRGIERAGWMFLTSLLLGLGLVGLMIVILIPGIVLAIANNVLFAIYLFIVILVVGWLAIRLSLALPATVVDNLNSIEALKLSWSLTRRTGVWARLLGIGLLLGLILIPASLGSSLLLFPAVFGQQPALLLVAALVLAFVTPLGSLPIYSAYRRLVPPIPPSWTGLPPAALATGAAAALAPGAALTTAAFASDAPVTAPMVDAAPAFAAPATAATTFADPGGTAAEPVGATADRAGTAAEPVGVAAAPAGTAAEPTAPPPLAPLVAWADPNAPPAAPPPAAAGWAGAGAPYLAPVAPSPAVATTRQPFQVPAFGAGARAIVGILLAVSVAGILAVPWVAGEFVAGRINLPTLPGFPGSDPGDPTFPGFPSFPGLEGAVTEGSVAFGSASDLATCTLEDQTTSITSADSIVWMGSFTRRVTTSDLVELRVLHNGAEILRETENPGTFDCLGTDVPDSGLAPGAYAFELILNGTVDATGTLLVTP